MNIKVSIIVPVYNRAQVLEKCISSIIHQDYRNIEIILVNDGSTDRSKDVCIEYKDKDSRIVFIDQVNAGVSSARNTGIKSATGDYIMFVDSDDYLSDHAISNMIPEDQTILPDWIIACVKKHVLGDTQTFQLHEVNTSNKQEIQRAIYELEDVFSLYQPVAKLYKAEIVKKQQLLFRTDLKRGEDFEFNCRYGQLIESISIKNIVVYHYILGNDCNLSQAFYENSPYQDSIIFASLRQLHEEHLERAQQIQMEQMWSSLTAISSKKCRLRFWDKVYYIRDYQGIPYYYEVVKSDNVHFNRVKRSIMSIKNPFFMTVLIMLVCSKRRYFSRSERC